jgi:hypothetical protein
MAFRGGDQQSSFHTACLTLAPFLPAMTRLIEAKLRGRFDVQPGWNSRVRERAFFLWEQEKDLNVSAQDYWHRACDIERDSPAPLEIEKLFSDYLEPQKSRIPIWFRNLFGISRTDWKQTLEETDRRRIVFALHKNRLDDIDYSKHEIAAVDIFVEKAQRFLELKSRQWVALAGVAALLLAGVIAADFYWLTHRATIPQFFQDTMGKPGVPGEFGGLLFTMWVLRGAALSALSGAAIYFLASLVRAFLHEATVFWNRRHSVRLGRLFIYLKFAGIDKEGLPKMRGDLKIEDIERAFGWNLETSTAFRDIKPELMTKGSLGDVAKILDAASKMAAESAKRSQAEGQRH